MKTLVRLPARTGLAALALAAAALVPGTASAGQCPAGKQIADATKPVDFAAKGVTDTVLSSIDLAREPAQIQDRKMRLRRLVIQPGGIVPWHSHMDRPAIIYIVQGEITEYASNCAVPILHKAGEVAPETHATSHWWKNTGRETVVLLSADLLKDPNDQNM
ncbi:cupin domain-containing protein [Prosthecomicrobium sp. N25]|uniref:cupin domain-containing protein n=1 Tax=Prosthecomicrobium sp. N25 TaxID=3129254 RepID=UPI003077E87D